MTLKVGDFGIIAHDEGLFTPGMRKGAIVCILESDLVSLPDYSYRVRLVEGDPESQATFPGQVLPFTISGLIDLLTKEPA